MGQPQFQNWKGWASPDDVNVVETGSRLPKWAEKLRKCSMVTKSLPCSVPPFS